MAIGYGASAVGLVSAMPSGPGVISEELIARVAEKIPPSVTSVLLTSSQDVDTIIAQQRRCRVNALQLVDRLPAGSHQRLREALPGISLLQVVHVTGSESIAEAIGVAPYVHALLLDSGNPSLAIKELGGTGRIHDWQISRTIRESVDVPIFLAGGIRSDNVARAMQQVEPFGLDICSAVRTSGKLDEQKLAQLFSQIQRAYSSVRV